MEAVTAENASRLAPVVGWRLADPSLAELLVDPARAIGPIAIDAARQSALVNRYIGTGSRMLRPVGIEEYALTDGRLLRTTRIPADPDLTGRSRTSSRDVVFDLSRRQAYLTCGWETPDGGCGLFQASETPAEPVDLRPGVVSLSLDRDAPRLLVQGVRLVRHPVVDDQRLLVESLYPPRNTRRTQVAWVDRESGELGHLQAVPVLDVSQSIRGGVGRFVLIWAGDPARLAAIRVGGDVGQIEAQYEYADGWSPAGDVVDWSRSRWIVAEKRGSAQAAEDHRVRVYELPSLRVVCELPAGAFARTSAMTCVGRSSVLAVVHQGSPDGIVLFDVDAGREVARLPVPEVGDPGSWIPLSDRSGYYIGVRGLQWMQLFAVPPADTSSAPAAADR